MTIPGLTRPVFILAGLCSVAALAACAAPATPATAPATPASAPGVATTTQPQASGPATTAAPPAPSSSAAGTGAGGQAASCSASQVAVTLTHTGSAAGTEAGYLTFTNTGSAACTLSGWPAVTAITKAGSQTKVAHATGSMLNWTYTSPVPVVSLAHGQAAYAIVSSSETAVGNATSCPPPYTQLAVAIPGGNAATTISAWLPGAGAYLPACRSITGAPDVMISDINPPAILPRQ